MLLGMDDEELIHDLPKIPKEQDDLEEEELAGEEPLNFRNH